MIGQMTNSKKAYFSMCLLFLIIISSIQILGAEPIAKGKWQGKGEPSLSDIKISFSVLNQTLLDSIVVSYYTYGHTYIAKASTGIIQSYGNFSTSATGEGITAIITGHFLTDGISISGAISISFENAAIAVSWSGSFRERFSPPFLLADFMSDKIISGRNCQLAMGFWRWRHKYYSKSVACL